MVAPIGLPDDLVQISGREFDKRPRQRRIWNDFATGSRFKTEHHAKAAVDFQNAMADLFEPMLGDARYVEACNGTQCSPRGRGQNSAQPDAIAERLALGHATRSRSGNANSAIANYSQQAIVRWRSGGTSMAVESLRSCAGRIRLEAPARNAVAVGGVRHDRHAPDRLVLAQARRLSRTRLSRRRRLHGPGQLGDLARRRLQVRLRAAHRRAAVEHHGDPAAGAVRAARHRGRARSRAGLPRRLSALGVVAALGGERDRDLRDRSRRGDRHRDRAQSAVRHSARDRRDHHRARRVPDPVDAEYRLPLDRGLHRHAARRHRGVLRDPDRDGRSGLGRGDPRLRADHRDRAPIPTCCISRSASSARP